MFEGLHGVFLLPGLLRRERSLRFDRILFLHLLLRFFCDGGHWGLFFLLWCLTVLLLAAAGAAGLGARAVAWVGFGVGDGGLLFLLGTGGLFLGC